MSGSDKTRAKRNAKQREQTTVNDLADLGGAIKLSPLTAPHYRLALKYNENHDPADGQFTSGGGGGGIGPAMPKVRNQTHYHQLRSGLESNIYSAKRALDTGYSSGKPIDADTRKRLEHQHTVLTHNLNELNNHAATRGFKSDDKGISDAPNLRGDDAQRCGNCQYYTALPVVRYSDGNQSTMYTSGICDLYDFQADDEWLCDDWEAQTPYGMPMPADDSMADAPVMTMERKENPNHDPSNGQFASGGGGSSGGATLTRGFSAKYADEVKAKGIKPHAGAIYASTGEDVAHYYGQNQAIMKDHSNRYAVVTFKAPQAAKVYPAAAASKPGAYVTDRADTYYKVDKAIPASDIVSVKVYEFDKPKPGQKIKPRLVHATKEAAGNEQVLHAVAIINEDGEMEYLKPNAKKELPIVLYKQTDGRLRVVGWASNNRRDKDNPPELITEAAHKEFMGYLDANPDKAPEFWHWHTPGTAYAKADCWDYVDGFTVYSGIVYDGKESQAERAAVDGVGMSHGFRVLGYDEKERLITKYRTFEVSDLPITRAANPYTSYNVIRKEAGMPFSEAKRAYLAEKMGEDAVAKLEARTGEMKAAADALGIESKEDKAAPADTTTADGKKKPKPGDTTDSNAADAETADESENAQEDAGENAADEQPADKKPKPLAGKALSEKEIRAIIRDELATVSKEIGESVGGKVAVALKAVSERIDSMEASTTAAKNAAESAATAAAKSLDEAVAEMIAPRRKMNMYSPTGDKKNVTGEKAKAAVKEDKEEPTLPNDPGNDWFTTKVLKPAGLAA